MSLNSGEDAEKAGGDGGWDFNSKEYYDWYNQQMLLAQGQPQEVEYHTQQASHTQNEYTGYIRNPTQEQINESHSQVYAHMANLPDHPLTHASQAVDYSKSMQQMSHFFDVDKYQRDRAAEILAGGAKPKVTKKQIAAFKVKKREKQIKSLVKRMGPG